MSFLRFFVMEILFLWYFWIMIGDLIKFIFGWEFFINSFASISLFPFILLLARIPCFFFNLLALTIILWCLPNISWLIVEWFHMLTWHKVRTFSECLSSLRQTWQWRNCSEVCSYINCFIDDWQLMSFQLFFRIFNFFNSRI